jgi:hypothetical protein
LGAGQRLRAKDERKKAASKAAFSWRLKITSWQQVQQRRQRRQQQRQLVQKQQQ